MSELGRRDSTSRTTRSAPRNRPTPRWCLAAPSAATASAFFFLLLLLLLFFFCFFFFGGVRLDLALRYYSRGVVGSSGTGGRHNHRQGATFAQPIHNIFVIFGPAFLLSLPPTTSLPPRRAVWHMLRCAIVRADWCTFDGVVSELGLQARAQVQAQARSGQAGARGRAGRGQASSQAAEERGGGTPESGPSRSNPSPPQSRRTVQHPRRIRVLGLILTVFLGVKGVFFLFFPTCGSCAMSPNALSSRLSLLGVICDISAFLVLFFRTTLPRSSKRAKRT